MNRLYTSLFCLLATTLCSVFATAELQSVPTLEFDASDANSLTIIDGGVSTWKHKSKNTINFDIANEKKSFPGPDTPAATAANPANRPTLQTRSNNTLRPALYFDGVDDALVVPVELTSPTWTLIVVAAPFAPIAGGCIFSVTI